jgi:hypothetical protein
VSVLTDFLNNRISQLEDRKRMIPRYLKRSGFVGSKRDFKMEHLPKIQEEIDETKVAIRAIEQWRKNKNKK